MSGNEKDRVLFGWKERHKVALGVAEALDYLHSGISRPVIHRDVKSSNILLSDDFEPQVTYYDDYYYIKIKFPLLIAGLREWKGNRKKYELDCLSGWK